MVAASAGGVITKDEAQVLFIVGIPWAIAVAIRAFAYPVSYYRRKEHGIPRPDARPLASSLPLLPFGLCRKHRAWHIPATEETDTPMLSPDLSQGLMAAAGGRAGRFLDVDFRPGV
jgi:hypothetical protein